MVKSAFIIISVSDRVNALNKLIETIIAFDKFKDFDIWLMFQDYANTIKDIKYHYRYKKILVSKTKLGCLGARLELLKQMPLDEYDIFINMDDDMELTPYTNYDNAIKKALEPETGFVLTNWAKSEGWMLKKIPNIKNKFIPQIMVYQGGGMVYSRKIAKLMTEIPSTHAYYDDIIPITSYINGYMNYRDLSSLTIHRIAGKGGMRSYMTEQERPLVCGKYINYRYNSKGKPRIPLDSDVNEYAKQLHKMNKH